MKAYKLKDAILIFSEPRGGSTWLMEILNNIPFTVVNWEPLHPTLGVVPKRIKLGNFPYIPPEDTQNSNKKLFKKILSYRYTSGWNTKNVSLKKVSKSKHVISKFVRANQLLPWISKVFGSKLNHPPIYLLRHPLTTCMSQLRTFDKLTEDEALEILPENILFPMPGSLNAERFLEYRDYLNGLKTRLERQIAFWCINNSDLIRQSVKEDWIVVYYENLVVNSEVETQRIIKELNLKLKGNPFKNYNFKRPSASNFNKSDIFDTKSLLESLINRLDTAYLDDIQRIFDYFDLKVYLAAKAYPNLIPTQ